MYRHVHHLCQAIRDHKVNASYLWLDPVLHTNTMTPTTTLLQGRSAHPPHKLDHQSCTVSAVQPRSRPQRVITRYTDGGGSQVWMTWSEEEEEAELQPWLADEIASCHYEYVDDANAATPSNQDGIDSFKDGTMYENDENYRYDVEGDELGPREYC